MGVVVKIRALAVIAIIVALAIGLGHARQPVLAQDNAAPFISVAEKKGQPQHDTRLNRTSMKRRD